MKKTFALLFVGIIIGIASIPTIGMANNSEKSQTVTLKKKPVKIPDTPSNMDPEGRRAPSRPITCIISPEGLQIPGIDTTEIYLYEVYDTDGEPLASFTEMSDFIDYIFGATATIEIRLHIDGYILCGYIYL